MKVITYLVKIYIPIITLSLCCVNSIAQPNDKSIPLDSILSLIGDEDYDLAKVHLTNNLNLPGIENHKKGELWHTYGLLYYFQDSLGQAIESLGQAIEVRLDVDSVDYCLLTKSYRNLGISLLEDGKSELSLVNFKKAAQAYDHGKCLDDVLLADLHTYSANAYLLKGHLTVAKKYFDLAEDLIGQANIEKQTIFFTNKLLYLSLIGDFNGMVNNQEYIISLYNEDSLDYYDIPYLSNAYQDLAIAYDLQDSFELATSYYNKAISMLKQLDDADQYDLVLQLSNLTELQIRAGRFDEAKANLDLMTSLLDNDLLADPADKLAVQILKVEYLIKNGECLKAADAILPLQLLYDSTSTYSLDYLSYFEILKLKTSLSSCLLTFDHISRDSLISDFDLTLSYMNNFVFSADQDHRSKQSMINTIRLAYNEIIKGLLTVYKKNLSNDDLRLVLSAADLAKAQLVRSATNKSSATTQESSGLSSLSTTLSSELVSLQKKIELEQKGSAQLQKDYLHKYHILDSLKSRTQSQFNPKEVSLESMDFAITSSSELLIEYHVLDADLIALTKGISNSYSYYEIGNYNHIRDSIALFRDLIIAQQVAEQAYDAKSFITFSDRVKHLGYYLFQALLNDVLSDSDSITSLSIVPDGLIGLLPFDALTYTLDSSISLPFLISKYAISYSYAKSSESNSPSSNLIETVDAYAPFSTSALHAIKDNDVLPDVLDKLNFSSIDIVDIKTTFPDMNSYSSLDEFNNSLSNADIIHLGTHAFANSDLGDYSYFALGNSKKEYIPYYVIDLYNRVTESKLITLSGCETGQGNYISGEGVMSIARAFLFTGAQSVVSSLWKVDDRATSQLTSSFYNNLRLGQNKSEALKNAKLSYIHSKEGIPIPYYWASFVPVGDMSTLTFSDKTENNVLLYLIGFMFIVFLSFTVWTRIIELAKQDR